jgi:hypothetical protein
MNGKRPKARVGANPSSKACEGCPAGKVHAETGTLALGLGLVPAKVSTIAHSSLRAKSVEKAVTDATPDPVFIEEELETPTPEVDDEEARVRQLTRDGVPWYRVMREVGLAREEVHRIQRDEKAKMGVRTELPSRLRREVPMAAPVFAHELESSPPPRARSSLAMLAAQDANRLPGVDALLLRLAREAMKRLPDSQLPALTIAVPLDGDRWAALSLPEDFDEADMTRVLGFMGLLVAERPKTKGPT